VTNCLVIYDVSKAEAPKVVKVVPQAGDHTHSCIYDCQYFIGSSGTIVDARDPANASVVRYTEDQPNDPDGERQKGDKIKWTDALGALDQGCHHQNEIRPGIVAAACQPMHVVSMNAEDGGSVTNPKVLAKYRHEPGPKEDPPYYSSGVVTDPREQTGASSTASGGPTAVATSSRWPRRDELQRPLLGPGRRVHGLRHHHALAAGLVHTRPTRSSLRTATTSTARAAARPRSGLLGALVRGAPDVKNGGIVALAEYEQGTRILQVTPEGRIRQLGFALPLAGSVSAPHWGPDGRTIYNIDYTRGWTSCATRARSSSRCQRQRRASPAGHRAG
jgi:hypothetical protein